MPRTPSVPAVLARALGVLVPVLVCLEPGEVRAASGPTAEVVAAQLRDAAMAGHDVAYSWVSELKGRGCRFALDDFGSGVSSFVYLKTLPVDFLKIDGQFISHIAQDPVNRSMVEAISKVGRALGIATVAECVESEAVLAELRRIGVDFAQGFHLAPPLPITQLPQ